MKYEDMKKIAIDILSCQVDDLEEIKLQETSAIYYRNKIRGGGAVIISDDGTLLFEDPFFVDFNEHLQKFIDGERSNLS